MATDNLKQLQKVVSNIPYAREAAVAGAAVIGYQALCYASQTIKGIKAPVTTEEDSVDIRIGDWIPTCVLEYTGDDNNSTKETPQEEKKCLPIPAKVTSEMEQPKSRKYLYHWKQVKNYVMYGDMEDTTHKYYDFENGWCFDYWGVCHVHITTIMPNVTPVMFMWWFENMCCGKGKHHWYRWWHPTDHIRAWYDDHQIHPTQDKTNGLRENENFFNFFFLHKLN
ncbi:hypothetical protein RFI_11863 [Reticulomyxa filosa]|uniref:DAPG hydrolase PhiG domain-containing protein n=1 Tax=Reticulomyxa filosa TaxID=46433 RepID=X6NHQ8_RETFI|nr:hypothetical protein RFI_11863 [Reticulomyxa filosa]|eukprot:ETO25279.1 hypothetical protein RFI_11863 [Reticulomyxa filosa]